MVDEDMKMYSYIEAFQSYIEIWENTPYLQPISRFLQLLKF